MMIGVFALQTLVCQWSLVQHPLYEQSTGKGQVVGWHQSFISQLISGWTLSSQRMPATSMHLRALAWR
jgi:hypothetical protein